MTVGDRGRAVVPRCPHGIVTGEFESTMPHRTVVFVLYVALCCAVGDAVGGRGSGGLGVDIAHVGLNTSAFQCMKDTAGLDWAVFRAFHSFGSFDNSSLINLDLSQKAGIHKTDVYMFPCRGKDAATQVKELTEGLSNAMFSTVWIDVEENPSTGCSWNPTQENLTISAANDNCKFLDTLVNAITDTGTAVGIYSSHYEWNRTVGLSCTVASALPLWYSHYDRQNDCTDFQQLPFGGWTHAFAKQFDDNVGGNLALNACIATKVAADIDVLCPGE